MLGSRILTTFTTPLASRPSPCSPSALHPQKVCGEGERLLLCSKSNFIMNLCVELYIVWFSRKKKEQWYTSYTCERIK